MEVNLLKQNNDCKIRRGNVVSYKGDICLIIDRPVKHERFFDLMKISGDDCFNCLNCDLYDENVLEYIQLIGNIKDFKFEQVSK